jgi:hypothetical protein
MKTIKLNKAKGCRFIGHGMCGEGMENLVTTGKIQGKRDRGGQRKKILDGVCRWLGVKRQQRHIQGCA